MKDTYSNSLHIHMSTTEIQDCCSDHNEAFITMSQLTSGRRNRSAICAARAGRCSSRATSKSDYNRNTIISHRIISYHVISYHIV